MADKDLRRAFAQATKEAALEKAEQDDIQKESELLAAYGDGDESPSDAKDTELEDEWSELRRIAIVKFPEGAKFLGLSPKNRLVAIAHCLGWSYEKISKASGIHKQTVYKWITKRPDIKLFIQEFSLKSGTSDVIKERFSELEYNAFMCMKDILNDPTRSDGMLRLKADISKWVFERTRGKPSQSIEHTSSTDFRKFIEAMNTGSVQISESEKEELFKSN